MTSHLIHPFDNIAGIDGESSLISVNEVARLLNERPATARRNVRRLGFKLSTMRGKTGQTLDAVTFADARQYQTCRTEKHQTKSLQNRPAEPAKGMILYVVQPDPANAPFRFKIGLTDAAGGRFRTYKTLCPNMLIIRQWQCPLDPFGFERMACRRAAMIGRQVSMEVFDFTNVPLALKDLDYLLCDLQGLTSIDARNVLAKAERESA